MNREIKEKRASKRIIAPLSGKIKDILLLGVLGILLFYTAWKIFDEEEPVDSAMHTLTENEVKVMRILQELDGVGEASVVVYEKDEEVQSVVVVCEGAKDLQVVMNVREAVATALNTDEKSIKIYLKKE